MVEEGLHDDTVFHPVGMSFAGLHFFFLPGNLCGNYLDRKISLGGDVRARCKIVGNVKTLELVPRRNLARGCLCYYEDSFWVLFSVGHFMVDRKTIQISTTFLLESEPGILLMWIYIERFFSPLQYK